MNHSKTIHKPKFDVGIITERFRTMGNWMDEVLAFVYQLDWLGDAKQHPEGSEHWELATVRDRVDFELTRFCGHSASARRIRADRTYCNDLLVDVLNERKGDGSDALHLMRRYHTLFGDESEKDCSVVSETFPDMFIWDVYLRVSALTELAEQFRNHIRPSVRVMHGWPMIVSHHLDGRRDFERVAESLELGAKSSHIKLST